MSLYIVLQILFCLYRSFKMKKKVVVIIVIIIKKSFGYF